MSVHVASAVVVQQEDAQDLLDAFKQCCQGWGFSPDLRNFALVLGNSVRVWGSLALALSILCSLFMWDFRTLHLAALVVWPFSSVWLAYA